MLTLALDVQQTLHHLIHSAIQTSYISALIPLLKVTRMSDINQTNNSFSLNLIVSLLSLPTVIMALV